MTGSALLIVPIAAPVLAATLIAVFGWRPTTAWFGLAAVVGVLADAGGLAWLVTDRGVQTIGGALRADALSAWMLLVIAAVASLACWASPAYLARSGCEPGRARWYGLLLYLFVAAMAGAVLAANLGVMWIAVEATTVVTAFLVGHQRSKAALEAAWKYVLLCSAAIAIAFLGLVLLYDAARHAGISGAGGLRWADLAEHARALDPRVTRMAVGLAVIGFGAKAGMAPLHAWLPDAHSQAPAPVSALMSGVLLSVALYAVLRLKVIADLALGAGYVRTLLLVMALATLALAALLLIGQRDYKRMLAYSSMEHMGLMALGAAIGTKLALAAVLLHIAGHGFAKTVAFLASGHILHSHGSTRISSVRGLLTRAPALGATFAVAMLALLGFPPAAVFASELGIASAGVGAGLHGGVGLATAVAYGLAMLAFVALVSRTARMLLGEPDPAACGSIRLPVTVAAPLVVGLLAVVALGISTGPLTDLLSNAATIVGSR